MQGQRGVEANNRPRLPLAGETEGMGDFWYRISPSMVLVDVREMGAAFSEY